MRSTRSTVVVLALSASAMLAASGEGRRQPPPPAGARLADMPWTEAETLLTPASVVVVPVGAASKEHGPHLKLRNDEMLAEYLTARVIERARVVVAPTLTYHYYPAFVEYPGSTTLTLNTARDLTTEVVRSLARYGPRRFYVLNTGISTVRALEPAAKALASDGILMRYTALERHLDPVVRKLSQQEGGTHADEVETSMMLYINPASVEMSRAVKDYSQRGTGPLTRRPDGPGTYSPTGTWGDPTLATAEKGRAFSEALVNGILSDISQLQSAALPVPAGGAPPARDGRVMAKPAELLPERCSPGDERAIRGLGDLYAAHWANADAERLAGLWAGGGDVAHPDGYVERGPMVIRQNRAALFAQRTHRNTRHPLTIGNVRCLDNDTAVADGKWELRGVTSLSGERMPISQGLCTIVVKRTEGAWRIEAYRYTVTPAGAPQPTLLKRPGYTGGGA
jgi:creatinine amidohydrolase